MAGGKRSLIELKAFSRHGDIYRWLRENYDRVEPEVRGLKRTWEAIARDIAAEGVKGSRGKEPYANSVRRIWPRVCRDVEAERNREAEADRARAAAAEVRRNYPSRLPANWRPEAVAGDVQRVSSPAAGSGRALAPRGERLPSREGAETETMVQHPFERHRTVAQTVQGEAELRAQMVEKGSDGLLTQRAVELTLAWDTMEALKFDKWLGAPQGKLVLENEVIVVVFEKGQA